MAALMRDPLPVFHQHSAEHSTPSDIKQNLEPSVTVWRLICLMTHGHTVFCFVGLSVSGYQMKTEITCKSSDRHLNWQTLKSRGVSFNCVVINNFYLHRWNHFPESFTSLWAHLLLFVNLVATHQCWRKTFTALFSVPPA